MRILFLSFKEIINICYVYISKLNFMDFIEHVDAFYIKISLLAFFVIGYYIVARKNNLKLTLQYLLYSYGIAILLLSTSIPFVFPGYPDDISALENKKMLLYHLHKNNDVLCQVTEVIRDMALITFMLIVIVISKIIKHLKVEKSAE